MNRDHRFELLACAGKEELCRLAEKVLEDTDLQVIKKPSSGMIMMRCRDNAHACVFNFGEILVTEAEVRIGNSTGYAMVLGMEPEKTLACAILDCAIEAGQPLAVEILQMLRSEEQRLQEEKIRTWKEIETTKVDFEVMM
jgi:alpha-D-ribose 1-methylphosphonate 5-triphosphate synthase subunit PhnG